MAKAIFEKWKQRSSANSPSGSSAVVALGGGAFVQPANRELIENSGVTVWLDCPLEMIRKRLGDDSRAPSQQIATVSKNSLPIAARSMRAPTIA